MTFYQNEDGEYTMSPEQIRAEWAADERDQYDRFIDDDEFFGDQDEPTCNDLNMDDDDAHGRVWCYGCDDYADHTLGINQTETVAMTYNPMSGQWDYIY